LQDAPRQITAVREALEKQDAAAARLQAHSLKGASANVGAFALKNAAHEAEKSAAGGDLAAVTRLVPVIEEQLDRLRSTLEEIGVACSAAPPEEATHPS
jgi:HPt (histidine-containing phosphotransfer) domain-containing protein